MNSQITSRFLNSIENLADLNIVGVLLGGSVIYKHNELNSLDAANDWDGLLLVECKMDIVNLFNEHRSKFCAIFDFSIEDCSNLLPPEIGDGKRFEVFDAVRFSGTTTKGIKKSLKILSVEHLNTIFTRYDAASRINILSSKDGRVAGSQTESKRYRRRIRQATRLDENLFILHDMDIFLSERCHAHGYSAVMFGVTTDLFMSGQWIYQDNRQIGDSLSMNLFIKLNRMHSIAFPGTDLTHIFARHKDFQPKYTKQLKEKLASYESNMNKSLIDSSRLKCGKECAVNMDFFWGTIPPINEIIDKSTLIDLKTKESRVAQFYNRVQRPENPLFLGETFTTIRLVYAKQELVENLEHSHEQENIILTIELQRAEDMLRAYSMSAKMPSNKNNDFPSIHQLFYRRLVNNTFMNESYGNGISLPCENADVSHLTLEQLLNQRLNINGKQYGSLKQIFEKAEKLLSPDSFIDQLVIFGLGNGFSNNVLVSNRIQSHFMRHFLYTNYEFAGYHSPILDLAKYFYYDVFFNIFYADHITTDELFVRNIIQLSFHDANILTININIPSSMLSKAILEIKKRYILVPFLKFIEKTQGKLRMPKSWPSIFGYALFCCALLTRNFSERPDVFFANLALGVILTDIKEISTDGHFLGLEKINLSLF